MRFGNAVFAVIVTAALVALVITLAPSTVPEQASGQAAAAPVIGHVQQEGAMSAPRNVQAASVPTYRPGPHEVNITVHEENLEIAPGVVVKAWTFGDRAPGPVIRVRVGDRVDVSLTNKGTIPHSIDFHAARVAPNRAFRDVAPGGTFRFSFTPTDPGVFMYHCGTPPVQHHIANGMYGMIIVEPRGGLPPVDQEIALVQSDWYVAATPGQVTPDDRLSTGVPDLVTFNGYANQYKDHPIAARKGTRIRAFVLAAGPNEPSAFHVVGSILDRVWLDGIHPQNLSIGNQTANIGVAQGAVAEFTLAEEGTYPVVTHQFTGAGKGAIALLRTPGTSAHPPDHLAVR